MWIIDNWYFVVVLLAFIALSIVYIRKFYGMPSEEQVHKIKEWLLYAVILAEKELGGGTGQMKLRYVYDLFLEKFPSIARVVTFDMFSLWVDEVLEQMRHILETNEKIATFVGG